MRARDERRRPHQRAGSSHARADERGRSIDRARAEATESRSDVAEDSSDCDRSRGTDQMNLRIFDDVPSLMRGVAQAIVDRATNDASIALSGGSTPVPLYELLGGDATLTQMPITWVVVDERYVPIDD